VTTYKNKLFLTAVLGIWLIVNLLLSLFIEAYKNSSEEYPNNNIPSTEEIPKQEI
jgi:hypothetical protein